MTKSIGVIGSIAIDNIFKADDVPNKGQRVFGSLKGSFVGGIGANQAMELARYLPDVYFLGQVGNDTASTIALEFLQNKRVNISKTRKLDVHTGQSYMYLVSGNSDYFSVVDKGANDADIEDCLEISSMLENINILLVSLEINKKLVRKVVEIAKQKGLEIWLSPSPAEECTKEILSFSDHIILNEREATMLLDIKGNTVEEIANELRKYESSFKTVLVSLGEKGALLKKDGYVYHANSYDVEPIDSVGAGDALVGTYLATQLLGYSAYESLSMGCISGSLTVGVEGAQNSNHRLEDLIKIYNKCYKNKEGIIK